MCAFVETDIPIPYRVVAGSRQQTADLSCMFIADADVNMYPSGIRNDTRFYGSLTSGGGNLDVVLSNHGDDFYFDNAEHSAAGSGYSQSLSRFQAVEDGSAEQTGSELGLVSVVSSSSEPLQLCGVGGEGVDIPNPQPCDGAAALLPHATGVSYQDSLPYGVVTNFAYDQPLIAGSDSLGVRVKTSASASTMNSTLPVAFPLAQDQCPPGLKIFGGELSHTDSRTISDGAPDAPPVRCAQEPHKMFPQPSSEALSLAPSAADLLLSAAQGAAEVSSEGNTGRKEKNLGQSDEAEVRIVSNADGLPSCSACGASSKKNGNLLRHIATVHLKKRPFACTKCDATFGYKTHLKRHRLTLHEGPSPNAEEVSSAPRRDGQGQAEVMCTLCGREFSQRSNLNRHMISVHQGVRHPCPACNKSFGQRFDLSRHLERCAESGDPDHIGHTLSAQER